MVKFRRGRNWKQKHGGGGGGGHRAQQDVSDANDIKWVDSIASHGPYTEEILRRVYNAERQCTVPEKRHSKETCPRNALCLKGIRTLKGGTGSITNTIKRIIGEAPEEVSLYELPSEGQTVSGNKPKGLRNLGNTCYLNAVIQSLFFNSYFRGAVFAAAAQEEIDSRQLQAQSEGQSPTKPPRCAASDAVTLWSSGLPILFAELELSNKAVVSPEPLLTALQIKSGIQQDAQEFFGLLIMWLMGLSPQLRSELQSEFVGTLLYTRHCRFCEFQTKKSDDFAFLTLPMPCGSVENGLVAFLSEEMEIDDFRCENCGKVGAATSRVALRRAPQTLVLHLLRFQYDVKSESRNKLTQTIAIPHKLDLQVFTGNTAHKEYSLRAVINHIGAKPVSGHYVAHVVDPGSGKWYCCDDKDVKVLQKMFSSTGQIESSEAYLLLYRACDDTSVQQQPPQPQQVVEVAPEDGNAQRPPSPKPLILTPPQFHQRLHKENEKRAEQYARWVAQRDAIKHQFDEWCNVADIVFSDSFVLSRNGLCSAKDDSPLYAVPLRWLKFFGSGQIANPSAEYTTSEESSSQSDDVDDDDVQETSPNNKQSNGESPAAEGLEIANTPSAEQPCAKKDATVASKRRRSNGKPHRRTVPIQRAVPTLSLLCPHKQGIDINAKFKLITADAWKKIVELYGADVPFDTALGSSTFCNECAAERICAMQSTRFAACERERMLQIAACTNYEGKGVFVNSSILNSWCAAPPVEQATAVADEEQPLRDLGEKLACQHGGLSTKTPRRAIPDVLYTYLESFGYRLSVVFPCETTKPCEVCIREGELRTGALHQMKMRVVQETKTLPPLCVEPFNFNRLVFSRDIANYTRRHRAEWQKAQKAAAASVNAAAVSSASTPITNASESATSPSPPCLSADPVGDRNLQQVAVGQQQASNEPPVCPPRRQFWYLINAAWAQQWYSWTQCRTPSEILTLVPEAIDNSKFICEHGKVLFCVDDLHPSKCPAAQRKLGTGPIAVGVNDTQFEYLQTAYGVSHVLCLVEHDEQRVLEPPSCDACLAKSREEEDHARRFFSNVSLRCTGKIRVSKRKLVTLELELKNLSFDTCVDDVREQVSAQILEVQKSFVSSNDIELFEGKMQLLRGSTLQECKVTSDSQLLFELSDENRVLAAVSEEPQQQSSTSKRTSGRRTSPKKMTVEVGFAGSRLQGEALLEADDEAFLACGVCTFHNAPTANMCEMCGAPLL